MEDKTALECDASVLAHFNSIYYAHTGLLEVTGLGASLSILGAVTTVWFISAGENHEPLVREPKLDVAVEVGAAPQGFAERRLPAAHGLCHELSSLRPSQCVHFLHTLGTCKKSKKKRKIEFIFRFYTMMQKTFGCLSCALRMAAL